MLNFKSKKKLYAKKSILSINSYLCLLLGLIISLAFFAHPIQADTLPKKFNENNVVDHAQKINANTIEKIKQWNDKYNHAPIKSRLRICIFNEIDTNQWNEITTNINTNWQDVDHPMNDIYFIVDLKNHKIQTETTSKLTQVIHQNDIQNWHDTIMPAMKQNDLNQAIISYTHTVDQSLDKYKNQKLVLHSQKQKNSTHDQTGMYWILGIGGTIVGFLLLLIAFLLMRWNGMKQRLKRSNYGYRGKNKLYPDMNGFVHNPSWTEKRLMQYIKKLENQ